MIDGKLLSHICDVEKLQRRLHDIAIELRDIADDLPAEAKGDNTVSLMPGTYCGESITVPLPYSPQDGEVTIVPFTNQPMATTVDLKEALLAVANKHSKADAKSILLRFGASKISDVPSDKIAEVVAALKAVL